MQFDLLHFHEGIKKDRIMFCYSGPISQSTIEGIGKTLRMNMEIEEAGFNVSQAVFSIFVEQMQNVLNYSAENLNWNKELDKELRAGILVISQEEENFAVYCGNLIYNSDVQQLEEKIEAIRALNKEELKQLYKKKRKEASEIESKGAGLGLIEMARKAGTPIEYKFTLVNDNYTFFSIKVTVRRKKDG